MSTGQKKHTRTSKKGLVFTAGQKMSEPKEITLGLKKTMKDVKTLFLDDNTKTLTINAKMWEMAEYLSSALSRKKEEFTIKEQLNALSKMFNCSVKRIKGESPANFKIQLSKTEDRFTELRSFIANKLSANKIEMSDLEIFKSLLLDISEIEGYEKQSAFAIYLVAEKEKGNAVNKVLADVLFDILNKSK